MALSLCYWQVICGAILSSKSHALDSGVVVHVCSLENCPGYSLEESPGSRSGQRFLMGDGGTIANLGQKSLNLSDDDHDLRSVFQIAAVSYSSSRERRQGLSRLSWHKGI